MNIHDLGNEWPQELMTLSLAGVVAYDEKIITVRPPVGAPDGPAFAASGFVGVACFTLEKRSLRKDWLWLKVGDPAMNDDGTQAYPILDKSGCADVKVGALALYAGAA